MFCLVPCVDDRMRQRFVIRDDFHPVDVFVPLRLYVVHFGRRPRLLFWFPCVHCWRASPHSHSHSHFHFHSVSVYYCYELFFALCSFAVLRSHCSSEPLLYLFLPRPVPIVRELCALAQASLLLSVHQPCPLSMPTDSTGQNRPRPLYLVAVAP